MKYTLLKLKLTFLILFLINQDAFSQTRNHPWAVGLSYSISEYNGDVGNGFFKFRWLPKVIDVTPKIRRNTPGLLGVSLNRYINSRFDANLMASWGEWGYQESVTNRVYRNTGSLGANLNWKFLNNDDLKIRPYLTTGIAYRRIMIPTIWGEDQNELNIPLGVGATYSFNEKWAVNLQTAWSWTSNDNADGVIANDNNDQIWNHTIAVRYMFGKAVPIPGDADGDGVKDSKDNCPDSPKGFKVDKNGCTVDTDKDGVADNLDKCPEVVGLAKFNGCPDSDNDGVQDSEDKCPTVPGLAQFAGCPDSDNDGVQDSEDKCPTVPGLAQFNGCPDTDGDGIQDSEDKCPTVAGVASNNGCPEEKKAVVEEPKKPIVVEPKALEVVTPKEPVVIEPKLPVAPEPKKPVVEPKAPEVVIPKEPKKPAKKTLMLEDINNVKFEFDSYKIRQESIDKLLVAVEVLKAHPNYTLVLDGYADNTGPVGYNITLSKNRAESVKRWLVAKGIRADRIKTYGRGIANPIGDNNTEEGRFENRRVELKSRYYIIE